MLGCLTNAPVDPAVVTFARSIFRDLASVKGYNPRFQDLKPYLTILQKAGEREEVAEICSVLTEARLLRRQELAGLWGIAMEASLDAGDEKMLLRIMQDVVRVPGGVFEAQVEEREKAFEKMVIFYGEKGDVERARGWWEEAREDGCIIGVPGCVAIWRAGGEGVVAELERSLREMVEEEREAGGNGKVFETLLGFNIARREPTERIDEILAEMESFSAAHALSLGPVEIPTINAILQSALDYNNQETLDWVTTFLSSRDNLHIVPNLTTYALRLTGALQHSDINLSISLASDLTEQGESLLQIPSPPVIHTPLNNLLAKLSTGPDDSMRNLIIDLYTSLMTYQIPLHPSTLPVMLTAFVKSPDKEHQKFVTLLVKRHLGSLPPILRQQTIDAFTEYGMEPETPMKMCYGAYAIMARVLPELSLEARHEFLEKFFRTNNEEAALKVLTHMSLTPTRRPTEETYQKVFYVRNPRSLIPC